MWKKANKSRKGNWMRTQWGEWKIVTKETITKLNKGIIYLAGKKRK